MVKMFQEKMAGGSNDPDDLIVRAFKAYEVDDDGFIASKDVIGLFVAGGGEEKKEEAPPPAEEAPAEEAADDGAKKKKKKKKAAK